MQKRQSSTKQIEDHLMAKIALLEAIISDDTLQTICRERDLAKRDVDKAKKLLLSALANHARWRDQAIDFLNRTQRNKA